MKQQVVLLTIVLWSIGAAAQNVYHCRATRTAVVVDGRLDDGAWGRADSVRLVDVVSGGVLQYATTVRACWDSSYLYVAFHALDRTVRNTMAGHDESLYQQDVVELFVDPDGDGLYYYELEWNCLNAQFDLMMSSAPSAPLPSGETVRNHIEWQTPNTRSSVRVRGTPNLASDIDTSMTVEVALAWRDMTRRTQALPPRAGDTLRANFYRIEYAASGGAGQTEYGAWSVTGQVQFHLPAQFGALVFEPEPVGIMHRSQRSSAPNSLSGQRAQLDVLGRRKGTATAGILIERCLDGLAARRVRLY